MQKQCIAGIAITCLAALVAVNVAGAQQAPPNLTSISGVLTQDGPTNYSVNGVDVDLGPAWYVSAVTASQDYDADGDIKTIAEEFNGLVGQTVTLDGTEGRFGDFDIYTINGQEFRDTSGAPPVWAGGPQQVGDLHPGAVAAGERANQGGPPWEDGRSGAPPWLT